MYDNLRNGSSIYVVCFLFLLFESLNMNWIWVYIVWSKKLAGLPKEEKKMNSFKQSESGLPNSTNWIAG